MHTDVSITNMPPVRVFKKPYEAKYDSRIIEPEL